MRVLAVCSARSVHGVVRGRQRTCGGSMRCCCCSGAGACTTLHWGGSTDGAAPPPVRCWCRTARAAATAICDARLTDTCVGGRVCHALRARALVHDAGPHRRALGRRAVQRHEGPAEGGGGGERRRDEWRREMREAPRARCVRGAARAPSDARVTRGGQRRARDGCRGATRRGRGLRVQRSHRLTSRPRNSQRRPQRHRQTRRSQARYSPRAPQRLLRRVRRAAAAATAKKRDLLPWKVTVNTASLIRPTP